MSAQSMIGNGPASFTKLRNGDWGVRVPHATSAGAAITVTKRDGTYQLVEIDRVIWTDGQTTIASIRRQQSGRIPESRCAHCRCHRQPNAGAPGTILFDGCDYCGCEA